MSFKSIFKSLFGGNTGKKECSCHCAPSIEKKEDCSCDCPIEECVDKEINESTTEIKTEPTTIEKIADCIQETPPLFVVEKTTIIENDNEIITIKDGDVKITAKEIKEKVKRKPAAKKLTDEKVEVKPEAKKKPKKSPPKKENPL